METRADDSQLFEAARRQAIEVAQTLDRQRQDLSRVAPRHQEGTDLLGSAALAAQAVAGALGQSIARHLDSGNRP